MKLTDQRLEAPGLDQLRDGFRQRVTRPSSLLPSLIPDRNPLYMDRETARKNMVGGLVAGGFAAAVFALAFVAAFLYIAQS